MGLGGRGSADYPMEKMKNYQTMVYPGWVKALIDYHTPGSTSARTR